MTNPPASPAVAPLRRLTIATRESALARWQANHVKARLEALYPGLEIAVLGMTTQGDRMLAATLAKVGGKGLFVKELEQALDSGQADIAVHSMKDVPVQLPSQFAIAAITERDDPRDAFVSSRYPDLAALPAASVVGTSSLRRESQLRSRYPMLKVEPLRGNVQTRLRKLDDGSYAAIILAAAGLRRLGLEARIAGLLEPEASLPAPGQGALGIECLAARTDLAALLRPLNHDPTAWCVRAERAASRSLSGSCTVPLGAYARVAGDAARIEGFVGRPDGTRLVRAQVQGTASDDPEALGAALAGKLAAQGAREILDELDAASR